MYYNKGNFLYMFLTAIELPAVLLLTLYGSIVGVIVHHQRKENASVAPEPAGGCGSVQSTMQKVQADRAPEKRHSCSGHMRCSHHLVSRLLAARLDNLIVARVQTRSSRLKRSQLDDRVPLSSLLHELSRLFNYRRPLSLFFSACHLSEERHRR